MKQSISSVWLLSIILVFILIYACYITITINYSASFKLKNEMINIIQKHHGLTKNSGRSGTSKVKNGESITVDVGAFETINLYLRGSAYTAEGYCPTTGGVWYGVSGLYDSDDFGAGTIEKADPKKKYYYCVAKYDARKELPKYKNIYYKVRLFYKFEIPVLSEFLAIKVEGMTDEIYNPANDGGISESGEDFFVGP